MTPEQRARLDEHNRMAREVSEQWKIWNTMQALIGVSAGIAAVRATGEGRGAVAYGVGALVGYFAARRFVLPV